MVHLDDLLQSDRWLGSRAKSAVGPGQEIPESLVGAWSATTLALQSTEGGAAYIASFTQTVEQRSERFRDAADTVDCQPCLEKVGHRLHLFTVNTKPEGVRLRAGAEAQQGAAAVRI